MSWYAHMHIEVTVMLPGAILTVLSLVTGCYLDILAVIGRSCPLLSVSVRYPRCAGCSPVVSI